MAVVHVWLLLLLRQAPQSVDGDGAPDGDTPDASQPQLVDGDGAPDGDTPGADPPYPDDGAADNII